MFNEFPPSSNRYSERAQHALVLAKVRLAVLLVLDIYAKRIAFQKQFQIRIMLKNRMCCDLIEHAFQRRSPRLNKVRIKPPNGLLLRRWGNNNTGVIVMQLIIQP